MKTIIQFQETASPDTCVGVWRGSLPHLRSQDPLVYDGKYYRVSEAVLALVDYDEPEQRVWAIQTGIYVDGR